MASFPWGRGGLRQVLDGRALRALPSVQGRAGELGEAGPSGEPGVPVSTHSPYPHYPSAQNLPTPSLSPLPCVGRCWHARGAWRGWPEGLSGEWGTCVGRVLAWHHHHVTQFLCGLGWCFGRSSGRAHESQEVVRAGPEPSCPGDVCAQGTTPRPLRRERPSPGPREALWKLPKPGVPTDGDNDKASHSA